MAATIARLVARSKCRPTHGVGVVVRTIPPTTASCVATTLGSSRSLQMTLSSHRQHGRWMSSNPTSSSNSSGSSPIAAVASAAVAGGNQASIMFSELSEEQADRITKIAVFMSKYTKMSGIVRD
jgi:hypothetical protein